MASTSNLDNIATIHLMRWEAEKLHGPAEIPELDFERGGHGVVWDLCKRAGSTDEEAASVASSFSFGLLVAETLAAEPFDNYPSVRSIMDRLADSIGASKDGYMRGGERVDAAEADEARIALDLAMANTPRHESVRTAVAYALDGAAIVEKRCEELVGEMAERGIDEKSAVGQLILREVMKCSKAAKAELQSGLLHAEAEHDKRFYELEKHGADLRDQWLRGERATGGA